MPGTSADVTARLHAAPIPHRLPDAAARWIWLPASVWPDRQRARPSVFATEASGQEVSVSRFVTTFDVGATPRSADLVITADTRYRVYVNGEFAGDGPARPGGDYDNRQAPDWWFSDQVSVLAHLRAGRNVIGVEVVLGPTMQQDYSMGRGGLLADLEIVADGAHRHHVLTDAHWRCAPSAGHVGGTRAFDARRDPSPRWAHDAEATADWLHAAVVDDPRIVTPSGLRPVSRTTVRATRTVAPFPDQAPRLRTEPDGRLVVQPGGPCTFWLDFGRIHAAHVLLRVDAAPGAVVTCEPQEIIGRTDKNGAPEVITAGDGPLDYRGIELRSCRYLRVTVANQGSRPATIVAALEAVSYHTEPVGHFGCDDPGIEAIYAASVWTEQICAQTIHLDSPVHQEGLGCTGDYLIQSLIDYRVFGDATLARADILRTALLLRQKGAAMFHASYSLLWIEMLRDFYRNTGDVGIVRESLDCVEALLRRFEGYLGPEGIVSSAPNYMFVDWVGAHGHTYHHPPRFMGQGPLTMFLVGAFRNAGELFRACGQAHEAAQADARATALGDAARRALWRPDQGMYADGLLGVDNGVVGSRWLPADPGTHESFSQHTNVLAVRYGVHDGDEARGLLRRVLSDPTIAQMQPYFLHFALDALDVAGLYDEYWTGIVRRWQSLLDEEPGSLKEVWDGFDCDYSHSWSATPAYQLPARVLGIEPALPGFAALSVSPSLGELESASGGVPIPQGMVEVSLTRRPGRIDAAIVLPPGVPTEISFERMAQSVAEIEVDGPGPEPIPSQGHRLRRSLPARDQPTTYRIVARQR